MRHGLRTWQRRSLVAAGVLTVVAVLVGIVYQPAISQWGSTQEERARTMVGDSLVADADTVWTRSITIAAAPEAVWPWLVQIGVDRGGFYNYDWAEQLLFDPVHNATTIHEEWQHLAVGDVIHPMPGSDWRVVVVDPNRALVLDNPEVAPTDWTWSTELHRLDGDRTRLVTRIRGHKGSFFSYALDVPDLILFPRLLTGIKQRAEGTLPGMSGTHTGAPFPIARLPVHGWAAGLWLLGLAAFGFGLRRTLGFGRFGDRRRHPWITAAIAFVAGAGYMIMSDTPPVQYFTRSWFAGLLLAGVGGVYLGRRLRQGARGEVGGAWRVVPRAVASLAETGMFVVLPTSAVWQAATAKGWTVWAFPDHVVIGAAAVFIALGIARLAWGDDEHGDRLAIAAWLATGFALTGSGTVALLGAVLIEVFACPEQAVRVIADETEDLLGADSKIAQPML